MITTFRKRNDVVNIVQLWIELVAGRFESRYHCSSNLAWNPPIHSW